MPREDHIELDGVIETAMGGGQYSIIIEGGGNIRARLSGRMKRNHINVMPGDRVRVALSPYDLTHGFIVFRG